jgi:hypothetical protein
MRVSSKWSDDVSMLDSEIVHPLIGVFLEQKQRRFLNLDVLGMHHGDEHEVTPALNRMVEIAALATKGVVGEGFRITSEGLRRPPVDIARGLARSVGLSPSLDRDWKNQAGVFY